MPPNGRRTLRPPTAPRPVRPRSGWRRSGPRRPDGPEPRAEVGQPAVVRLEAGPAALVVGLAGWKGDEAALLEEGRDGVREQHLGGDPVGVVLGQAPVRVPAAVGGGRQQVGERVDVGGGPGVELVVPAATPGRAGSRRGPPPRGRRRRSPCTCGRARARCSSGPPAHPAWSHPSHGTDHASRSSADGGSAPLRDGVGPGVEQRAGAVEIVADHEPSLLHALDGEASELVEVDGVGRAPGGGQGCLELGERRARVPADGVVPGRARRAGCAAPPTDRSRGDRPRDRRPPPASWSPAPRTGGRGLR